MTDRATQGLGAWSLGALLVLAPGPRAQHEPARLGRAPDWLGDECVVGDALRRAVDQSLPEALPELLAYVCATDSCDGEPTASDERRSALREALARVPLLVLATGLAPMLEPAWDAAFDDRMRVDVLGLLAARAGAPELALLERIAQPSASYGAEQLRGVAVRTAYEYALEALLTRDPADSQAIWQRFDRLPESLRSAALRALARAGGDDTLERMVEELGARPELAAFLLPEIECAARRLPVDLDDGALAQVRDCLGSSDAAVVAAAVPLVALFADATAAPNLAQLLESEDGSLRERVRRALIDLTGRDAGERPGDWRSVLMAERRWWAAEGAAVAKALPTADAEDVSSALARLAAHPLHARGLGPCFEQLLRRPEPTLVALACATAARLRMRSAAHELSVVAREHANGEVRAAAHNALRVLAPDLFPSLQDEAVD